MPPPPPPGGIGGINPIIGQPGVGQPGVGQNQSVKNEDAGGIGAGSFFLGFLFGIGATLGYQWGDRNGKFDTAKAYLKEKYEAKARASPNPNPARSPPYPQF